MMRLTEEDYHRAQVIEEEHEVDIHLKDFLNLTSWIVGCGILIVIFVIICLFSIYDY